MRRVGLLGGAFDPPHEGHLRLARLALECLGLDELRFVPARSSPGKVAPTAGAEARLAMLRGMLQGTPFSIETAELDGGRAAAPSYTVDTLETLARREPDAAWMLVMGMDQAVGFGGWRDPARILELASVAVAPRPETGRDPRRGLPDILASRLSDGWSGAPGRAALLPSTEMEVSSSLLREHIASGVGGAALDLLPEKVRAVISENNPYR